MPKVFKQKNDIFELRRMAVAILPFWRELFERRPPLQRAKRKFACVSDLQRPAMALFEAEVYSARWGERIPQARYELSFLFLIIF